MVDPAELLVAAKAVRELIDKAGYGAFVNDAQCQAFAEAVLQAVADYRDGTVI